MHAATAEAVDEIGASPVVPARTAVTLVDLLGALRARIAGLTDALKRVESIDARPVVTVHANAVVDVHLTLVTSVTWAETVSDV